MNTEPGKHDTETAHPAPSSGLACRPAPDSHAACRKTHPYGTGCYTMPPFTDAVGAVGQGTRLPSGGTTAPASPSATGSGRSEDASDEGLPLGWEGIEPAA